MSFKSFVLRHRRLATSFMSSRGATSWEKSGAKKALKRFLIVAKTVPAYQKFLKEKGIDPEKIKTIDDFKNLPILDKNNYLRKYEIEDLCLDGKLHDKYLIDRSSGYSGASFFWPRTASEDQNYPLYMKLAYEQFYQIHKKKTLMIISLALGSWVGGEKISWATREIAINNKIPFTVITPGLNLEEILEIITFFKGKYDQFVLVGYPPFIKKVIDEGEKQGIDWKKINMKIGLGGEGYSEEWREYIKNKVGLPENDLMGVAGGYGAADLGMSVGREYPISVLIRKLAHQDKNLAVELFKDENLPSLCQYDPSAFYIEEVNKELIFSCAPGIPLIRYNIRDRGGVLPFAKAISVLNAHGYDPIALLKEKGYSQKDIWQLPFFYVFGRSDGTIPVCGGKIYVENIKMALENSELAETNTGKFNMKIDFDQKQNQKLIINIELSNGIVPNEQSNTLYQNVIVDTLRKVNSEYNILYQTNKEGVTPIINLFSFNDKKNFPDDPIKIKYI